MEDFDIAAPGEPTGKRTDFGTMLRTLYDRRDPALPLRHLVVVSDDPFAMAADQLEAIKVDATMVGGELVYERPAAVALR